MDTSKWPTEDWVQQTCLDDCLIKYDNYEAWWDSHSSGVSRLIRKLLIEDYVGHKISWDEYDENFGE